MLAGSFLRLTVGFIDALILGEYDYLLFLRQFFFLRQEYDYLLTHMQVLYFTVLMFQKLTSFNFVLCFVFPYRTTVCFLRS